MAKHNVLADKLTSIAQRQLQASWEFKLPRIRRIKEYRRLYLTQILPKLRTQFNVPLPVFSGMVDTLQADLNDTILIKYESQDPADWKAAQKANAAIQQQATSMRNGAEWAKKFRSARQECILTGRGTLKFSAGNSDGYYSSLESIPFEDFFFEPSGGGELENHLFVGQQNIWKTKYELEEGAKEGIYDKKQVAQITSGYGDDWKMSGVWDGQFDFANRFKPLGLNVETNNYVGDTVFNLCEWVLTYEGRRWYILFEAFTGTWIRFEKLSDVYSSELYPFISFASHEDEKNFASKAFADDLYPVADSIITLFNQELTNRQKRNLNAKAYDKDMFRDVQKLDEAQYRPDALVPADTKGGTRRISEGVFAFQTPEITGTVNLIDWIERDTGKNLGVTDLQQGASQPAGKKVGVAYTEMAQVAKRLSFMSQPFVEVGQKLGLRFFSSLKDYLKEPLAIKLLGEHGIEWDSLKRVDLSTKRDFEISIISQSKSNFMNESAKENKIKALSMTAGSPNINTKVRDEYILRDIGGYTEHDVALFMDTQNTTDKETQAEVSSAIQEIVMKGKEPSVNFNADAFFIKRLLEFAKRHQDTLPEKKYNLLIEYAMKHEDIAGKNEEAKAVSDARLMQGALQGALQGQMQGASQSKVMP